MRSLVLLSSLGLASAASVLIPRAASVDSCPGYEAKNVRQNSHGFVAELTLAGKACNVYGTDLKDLKLEVTYDSGLFPDPGGVDIVVDVVKSNIIKLKLWWGWNKTPRKKHHHLQELQLTSLPDTRLHVKISDPDGKRYQVPESVVPRPTSKPSSSNSKSDIVFDYKKSPFSFTVSRRSTGEKLFDTTGNALVFENQFLRLKTSLPNDPNIYGLGEHTESLRLNPTNTTRTLWSRDSYGIPQDSNLYGNHPVYFEHRNSGTHGVLLLNSNGMDIKLRNTAGKYSLEYNVIGGILDLYFFSGPDPVEVAQQYSGVVGLPAMMPYWAFGFHQCRYGYRDWIDVAEVSHSDNSLP